MEKTLHDDIIFWKMEDDLAASLKLKVNIYYYVSYSLLF